MTSMIYGCTTNSLKRSLFTPNNNKNNNEETLTYAGKKSIATVLD